MTDDVKVDAGEIADDQEQEQSEYVTRAEFEAFVTEVRDKAQGM